MQILIFNKFMKGQPLKQSLTFVKVSSYRSDMIDDELEFENPQNNFQKLMGMQPDVPGRELRNLIQSMSQHCTFEKNFIKKISHVEVPRYVKTEAKRREVYQDYETIKNYTIFSKKKQHFEGRKFQSVSRVSSTVSSHDQPHKQEQSRQNRKSSKNKSPRKQKQPQPKVVEHLPMKPSSLLQFVERKKNQMLMEDNILKADQTHVTNILNDNKKREKIFQEALFLQRLYDIEIEKLKAVGVSSSEHQVPEKFRGIEPRHIRISSEACATEQQYLRKKYVCKKRKLQFYGHAQKIQQSSLKSKKKQNMGVLETLMKFNEANINSQHSSYFSIKSKNTKEPTNIFQQDLKIKKLFLKYSSCETDNPDAMYKYMGENELSSFLNDFQLQDQASKNVQLKNFIQKKREAVKKNTTNEFDKEEKVKYFLFDFLEILYILASETSGEKTGIGLFMDQKIWPKQEKVVPEAWIKINKIKRSQKMVKYLKTLKFEQKCKALFEKKVKKTAISQFSIALLTFNDLLEMAWQLKLFPNKISKRTLRFMFLYCKSSQNGMTQADFFDLILVLGLKYCEKPEIEQKLKWIVQYISN